MTANGYWTVKGIENDVKTKSGQLREILVPPLTQEKCRERKSSSGTSLSVGKAVFKLREGSLRARTVLMVFILLLHGA